jgi:hypothetical protein
MRITYDPDKNARNIAERGLSFDDVERLDWNTAFNREGRAPGLWGGPLPCVGEDRQSALRRGVHAQEG